jgi:AraC-like DNA-binding protein
MTMASETPGPIRFSTEDLPPGTRLTAYREMLDRSVGNFEVEASAEEFDFCATSFALPGLGIAHIAGSALRIERTRKMLVADARDLILTVVHDGASSRVQRGREVNVAGSGAFLTSSHDPLMTERTAARLTNYALLSSDLAPMIADIDEAMRTTIPVDSEPIRLLTGYTDLVFGDGASLSAEACRLAISHIHDLIALAIGATRDTAEIAKGRGLRAARRTALYARARRFMALRCSEPDLAPREMARLLGISLRLLQKVFAERGDTVMGRLWDERATRAARLLAAPEAADRSITDIAFACGFNDSAHFGRVFAARKGMAPSRWRKRARDEQGLETEARELSRSRHRFQA